MKKIIFAVLILLGFMQSELVFARSMYVSDQLEINMRSGKSSRHKIFAILTSGEKVTVINHDKASGYSFVRNTRGKEGWVLTRYLMSQPSARSQLMAKQERIDSLSNSFSKVSEQSKELNTELKELKELKSKLERENSQLKQRIDELNATYGDEKSFKDKLEECEEKFDKKVSEMSTIQTENSKLRSKSDQLWVMAGGGILLLGIILGLLIPKIRWQKKSSWSSL